ncbi:MAG: hypothetical protein IT315_05260 [Anaerolineales bacterium]|nr:hypothetical protein [Anaerolineales bacterium]
MKRHLALSILFLFAVALFIPSQAQAQGETPRVIYSTKPISPDLQGDLDAWLATDAPAPVPFYVVTYFKTVNGVTQVSLAGVDLPTDELPEEWSMFEDGNNVVWMGSVTVQEDGTVIPFPSASRERGSSKLAMIVFVPPATGGGSYVAFPFQSGKAMIYGPRAVHGIGDYGTSGMVAVDLVSGDGLGAGAAPPYAYASDAGTIDYICDDGTTVAVRTHNASTGDDFIYAHLLDNASLVMSGTFSRGQLLGSIKYGSFDDDCGWADQRDTNYHIHWMFEPNGNTFQAEGCILNISTKKWTCGNDEIGTGEWLRGGGGFGFGDDEFASGQAERSFWSYLVFGFVNFVTDGWLKFLPDHQDFEFFYQVISTIRLLMRIMYVLVRANVNIKPIWDVTVYGIAVNALFSLGWIIGVITKTIKTNTPGA